MKKRSVSVPRPVWTSLALLLLGLLAWVSALTAARSRGFTAADKELGVRWPVSLSPDAPRSRLHSGSPPHRAKAVRRRAAFVPAGVRWLLDSLFGSFASLGSFHLAPVRSFQMPALLAAPPQVASFRSAHADLAQDVRFFSQGFPDLISHSFDPVASTPGTWASLAPMPFATNYPGAAAGPDGKIYWSGGVQANAPYADPRP